MQANSSIRPLPLSPDTGASLDEQLVDELGAIAATFQAERRSDRDAARKHLRARLAELALLVLPPPIVNEPAEPREVLPMMILCHAELIDGIQAIRAEAAPATLGASHIRLRRLVEGELPQLEHALQEITTNLRAMHRTVAAQ